MTVASVKQWFHVIPLLSFEKFDHLWRQFLPLISQNAAVAKARQKSVEIDHAGDLRVIWFIQGYGFARLIVEPHRSYALKKTWCIDIKYNVHFQGAWEKVPDFEKVTLVRLRAREVPRPGGDQSYFATYLDIFYTR